jgi:hypothetical protein
MIMVMMMMMIILKFIAFFKYTFPKQEELYGTMHIIPQTNIWTLANDQLDAQIFNTFITILYVYMFRAIPCSSLGGQNVLIQHLVSSL